MKRSPSSLPSESDTDVDSNYSPREDSKPNVLSSSTITPSTPKRKSNGTSESPAKSPKSNKKAKAENPSNGIWDGEKSIH
ncbi:uncharacterized protein IL334_000882 [Kwoniella shivajii]|uniref:Uncharacterized protein n=1 Tax=Kwoniella shivajii TaxID=564305 RepID=A0ABZ1CQE6_9TREE|nr:hypothetical protein IL334_000882 [Kwoniella shivajii]